MAAAVNNATLMKVSATAFYAVVSLIYLSLLFAHRDDGVTVAPAASSTSSECPSEFISALVPEVLKNSRVEAISGGHVSQSIPEYRTPLKVLFIVPKREHDIMMSRWYFHIYEAAQTMPHYDTYAWGEGYFAYDRICACMDSIVGRVLVKCPPLGWGQQKEGDEILAGRHAEAQRAFTRLPDYSATCLDLQIASFAEHINVLFDGETTPFDFIGYSWIAGALKRDKDFAHLSPTTAVVMFEVDWHVRSLRQWRGAKPDIVLTSYVDNLEENFPLRDFVRALPRADDRRTAWLGADAPAMKRILGTFWPQQASESNNKCSGNCYEANGVNTLFVYGRHSILPQCSPHWTRSLNRSDTLLLRFQDITMVGSVDEHYPTRNIFAYMLKSNVLDIAKHAKSRPHPGYSESKNRGYFHPNKQFEDYIRTLSNSKICFIGGISTWTIRKYKEAMSAGCLVVGDVPADYNLAKYIVNPNLVPPGFFNFNEDLDVQAANTASDHQLANIDNWWCAAEECTHTLEEERTQYRWSIRDPYSKLSKEKLQLYSTQLARALLDTLARYEKGEYDAMIIEARRVVLTEYSSYQLLSTWLEPAIAAWRQGERGWLRTPAYFQDSYKYRAKHYFLLREWLLQREGSVVVPELNDMTYGKLLQRASRRLREDIRDECAKEGKKDSEFCNDPSMDYFPHMADIDLSFVKARNLYSSNYALDGYSHLHRIHMRSLY